MCPGCRTAALGAPRQKASRNPVATIANHKICVHKELKSSTCTIKRDEKTTQNIKWPQKDFVLPSVVSDLMLNYRCEDGLKGKEPEQVAAAAPRAASVQKQFCLI